MHLLTATNSNSVDAPPTSDDSSSPSLGITQESSHAPAGDPSDASVPLQDLCNDGNDILRRFSLASTVSSFSAPHQLLHIPRETKTPLWKIGQIRLECVYVSVS